MKKQTLLKEAIVLLIATIMIGTSFVAVANTDENYADVAPTRGVPQGKGDFPILFEIDLPAEQIQCVGVGYDGENFWVSAGDYVTGFCEFYVYDEAGNLLDGPIHQGGGATGWGHRDMAYNGEYMFGSYDQYIDGFSDPSTYEGLFQGPINPNRAMAYDGTYFYTSGYSEQLWKVEWDGNWGSVATTTDLGGPHSGAYGLAYDDHADCLWMTTADYSGNIYQFDMDGTLLNTYTTLPEYDIQGGCTMADTETYGYVLVVLQQFTPDRLTFYDLGYGGPNVGCDGVLNWEELQPGETATGEFTVENNGDPESLLNWEVDSTPEWGTWTFDPESGEGLTPEDGPVTVSVEVTAPEEYEEGEVFEGEVTVINSDSPSNFCTVDATMTNALSHELTGLAQSTEMSEPLHQQGAQYKPQNTRAIFWDQYDTDGSNGLSHADEGAFGFQRALLDDFEVPAGEEWELNDFHSLNLWNTMQPGSGSDFHLEFWSDSSGVPGSNIATATTVSYAETGTGRSWFSRPEFEIEYVYEPITLSEGTYWIYGYVIGPENCFWMAKQDVIWGTAAWVDYADYGGLQPGFNIFGSDYDLAFQLTGGGGGAVPDLDCDGVLNYEGLQPGETVTGEVTVENIGDDESELAWEIESYPDWGTWTFDPESGDGLTPEDGAITIEVEIVAPEEYEEGEVFEGEVVLVNSDDPGDTCTIDVTMTNAVSHPFLQMLAQRFPLLARLLDLLF